MLKFLLITFLIGYLLFKVIGIFFKFVIRGASASTNQQYQSNNTKGQKKPVDGNVNIDYVPNKDQRANNDFKGGEYVDYEEVK